MSDNLNELESLLAKYTNPAQGGDPASTPPPSPTYPVIVNGTTVNVASQEEALRLQAQEQQRLATLAVQARQYAEQLEQERVSQPVRQETVEAPKSLFDPQQFVTEFVTNPQEALRKTLAEMPEFKKKDEEVAQLKSKLARKEFAEAHPLYGMNPQIMQGLEKMRTQFGLPETPEGYEFAALKAQQMGYLMNEDLLRQQQRAALIQMLAQQQQGQPQPQSVENQNPYGQFQNTQVAPQPVSYNAPPGIHPSMPQMAAGFMNFAPPPPPPASGRNAYQGTNTVDTAIQMAQNGQLRGDALRQYLEAAERQGIS